MKRKLILQDGFEPVKRNEEYHGQRRVYPCQETVESCRHVLNLGKNHPSVI